MEKYDFDKNANRWDYYERRFDQEYNHKIYGLEGKVYNFGIADINYAPPEAVLKAIRTRAKKSSFSYSYVPERTLSAIAIYYLKQGLVVDQDDIKLVHGTVNAMFNIVQALSKEDEYVLLQTPIYKPFANAVLLNNRKVAENKLLYNETTKSYAVDFVDFEQQIVNHKVKLFMLCSPHNPGSTIWTKETLNKMLEICRKHDVTVFADEVHSGMIYKEFTSTWNLYDKLVLANSPNKVFNIGGLKASYLLIKNPELKKIMEEQYAKNSITSPNVFVNTAFQEAYLNEDSKKWSLQLKDYIYQNFLYLKPELEKFGFEVFDLQSTYLVWVKSKECVDKLVKYLLSKKIVMCDYHDFYGAGDSYLRINIATKKADLEFLVKTLKQYFRKK